MLAVCRIDRSNGEAVAGSSENAVLAASEAYNHSAAAAASDKQAKASAVAAANDAVAAKQAANQAAQYRNEAEIIKNDVRLEYDIKPDRIGIKTVDEINFTYTECLVGPPGLIGPKGDPFTYADFTPQQLESLKGPKGRYRFAWLARTKGRPRDTWGKKETRGQQGPQGQKETKVIGCSTDISGKQDKIDISGLLKGGRKRTGLRQCRVQTMRHWAAGNGEAGQNHRTGPAERKRSRKYHGGCCRGYHGSHPGFGLSGRFH